MKKILIVSGGGDYFKATKELIKAISSSKEEIEIIIASEGGSIPKDEYSGVIFDETIETLTEMHPNCFDELAISLQELRIRSENEKQTFYLTNDTLRKTHHLKNHRTQIRNQLPRKIRID